MAIALHPMCRTSWFHQNWSKQPDGEGEINNALTAVNEFWLEYLALRDALQAVDTALDVNSSLSTPVTTSKTTAAPATVFNARFYELMGIKRAERGEGDKVASKEREKLRRRGEFERFLQAELDLEGYENEPLRWWHERGKELYPILAGLAFTLLSMPAMSSECERSFSRAGKMVTTDRYSLKADIIEADQLLKSWLVSGLINRETAWQILSEVKQQALLNQHQGHSLRSSPDIDDNE
jgi:hypothetical protein